MSQPHIQPRLYLLVAAGAALGGVSRLLISDALLAATTGFPWGNLLVNVIGSLLIGFHASLPGGTRWTSSEAHLFISAGFCGGFTTFSLFSLELLLLLETGNLLLATLFVTASIVSWLLAVTLGHTLGMRITMKETDTTR